MLWPRSSERLRDIWIGQFQDESFRLWGYCHSKPYPPVRGFLPGDGSLRVLCGRSVVELGAVPQLHATDSWKTAGGRRWQRSSPGGKCSNIYHKPGSVVGREHEERRLSPSSLPWHSVEGRQVHGALGQSGSLTAGALQSLAGLLASDPSFATS